MRQFSEHDHPDIPYPGPWEYTIFGVSEELMRIAVAEIVGGASHTITPSKKSRSGKFVSMNVEVLVVDEAHRLGIGEALAGHADIGFVL